MLTKEQVKEALNTEHKYTGYSGNEYQSEGKFIIRDGSNFEYEGHKFTHEDGFGGEGQGDNFWIVFSVTNLADSGDVVYYKVPGWYQSHYGSELEWGSLFEVSRREKTIMVWEEVK